MKILPMMSRGVVFVHEDESIELAPMQVWLTNRGARIRIGKNVYLFNKDGTYDGSEHAVVFAPGDAKEREMHAMLDRSGENKGLAPETSHYPEGIPPHREETAAWPYAKHQPGGKNYILQSGKKSS